jgi:thioredoxin 1
LQLLSGYDILLHQILLNPIQKRGINSMSIQHFTDSNFKKEVLESNIPVLVDFWANWCGPCKMIGPVVEELAKEYAGKMKIGKLDVDTNSSSASTYGVMSIPTLIFFKNGKVMDQVSGALNKPALKQKIEENL